MKLKVAESIIKIAESISIETLMERGNNVNFNRELDEPYAGGIGDLSHELANKHEVLDNLRKNATFDLYYLLWAKLENHFTKLKEEK